MTKKGAQKKPQTGGTGADPTQDQLNELYTAHQVHTLAQLIYRQVAARRAGGGPWTPNSGANVPSAMQRQTPGNGWKGSSQGAPQPLVYWYS